MATYTSSSLQGQGILGEALTGGVQRIYKIDDFNNSGMCYLTFEATGSNFNFNETGINPSPEQSSLSGSFSKYKGGVREYTLIGGEAPVNGFLPSKVLTLPDVAVGASIVGTTVPLSTTSTGTGTGATVQVTSDGVKVTNATIINVGTGGVYAIGETITVTKSAMAPIGAADDLVITITLGDIIEAKGTNWPGAYKWSVGMDDSGEFRYTPQNNVSPDTYYIKGTGDFNLTIV